MEANDQAFPGRKFEMIGNTEMEIPVDGLTKREYSIIKLTAALSAEYTKMPTPPTIEMIVTTAIKMTDEIIKRLSPDPEKKQERLDDLPF